MRQDSKVTASSGAEDDFSKLFEESLRAVKAGDVVRGRVVLVTREQVTVDIGYKSEGQIPIREFLDRDGQVSVKDGDEIDVYFDSDEGEEGGIVLSREYYRLDDSNTPVTQAAQGELLRGRLTVIAPKALHYVVIDDPLPAGLEGVDTSLQTSPQGEQPEAIRWDDINETGWGWWYFDHLEMRDEKLVFSASYLPAGTYVFTYLVRASTPGVYNVIPPTGQEFYFPEVYGRGAGMSFEVK